MASDIDSIITGWVLKYTLATYDTLHTYRSQFRNHLENTTKQIRVGVDKMEFTATNNIKYTNNTTIQNVNNT